MLSYIRVTIKFIEEFRKTNPTVPFLTAKPTKDFFELAEEIGPLLQCHNTCRYNAFSDNEFLIDENKCTHCMECVKKPCLAIDVLRGEV